MGIQTTKTSHWARLILVIAVVIAVIGGNQTATATETRQDVNLLDGLVAYWPLDETSGVRYDAHAGYDLTDNNTVGYTTTGKIGIGAYTYGPSNEYLSRSSVVTGDIYTVVGWFIASTGTLIRLESSYDYLSIYYDGGYVYVSFGDGGLCEVDEGTSVTASDAWAFLVIEHNRVSEMITVTNGSVSDSISVASCDQPESVAVSVRLPGNGTAYIDEVCLYNRSVTDAEIASLYNSGNGLPYNEFSQATPSGVSGVVSYWSMDEPTGTRYDSADGNDLTPSGAPGSTAGRVGPAASFDGSDDYLSMSDVFTDSESFSAIAWAGIDEECETADDCPIMGVWGSTYTDREWRVRYYAGFVNLDVQTESGITTLSLQATPNDWHMIGAAYNATDETCRLQVDGAITETACESAHMGTDTPMRFAHDGLGHLDGAIDESVIIDGVYESYEWDILYNNAQGIGYSDLFLITEENYIYFPFIGRNASGGFSPDVDACAGVVCDPGYHCLNGECIPDDEIESIVPIDYKSASWEEWADLIDELLQPIFDTIEDTNESIEETNILACGQIGPDDAFVPSSSEPTFYEGQTTLDRVYNMGLAMGKPFAYIRALSAAGVLGMNYLTLLLAYFSAVILLFAFVGGVALTVRIVRGTAQLIKWIYELIPFKAT